jgi:hypothetical protein
MPRPKKQKALRRDHKLTIRLDETEYGRVRSEFGENRRHPLVLQPGKTAERRVRVPRYARIDTQSVKQLSKLGGLFKNTHNESGGLYSEKTAVILDEIYNIMTEIDRGLEDDRQTHSEPEDT